MTLQTIEVFPGDRPSMYGFPVRHHLMPEDDRVLLLVSHRDGRSWEVDHKVVEWYPNRSVRALTLFPNVEPGIYDVVVGEEKVAPPVVFKPKRQWLTDVIGGDMVDHTGTRFDWKCEYIGNGYDETGAPAIAGKDVVRWVARGWFRDENGAPLVEGIAHLTWRGGMENPFHVLFHVRNQAPTGAKWGSRRIIWYGHQAFKTFQFSIEKDYWAAGYAVPSFLADDGTAFISQGGTAFISNGDGFYHGSLLPVFVALLDGNGLPKEFVMAEGDGMVVEFIVSDRRVVAEDPFAHRRAYAQPFGVHDAWKTLGWGYADGAIPESVPASFPSRIRPLFLDEWQIVRANDHSSGDWYSIPRCSVRAEYAWDHQAGAPHRNDPFDLPFLVQPSSERIGYVEDMLHHAKSKIEMPHQTTTLDPVSLELWYFDRTPSTYRGRFTDGRPHTRANSGEADELSYEAAPCRWTLCDSPHKPMVLDREHADLGCVEQAYITTAFECYADFCRSRSQMSALEEDGDGRRLHKSDRMPSWYLQHHVVASRMERSPEEQDRRIGLARAILEKQFTALGKVTVGGQLIDAPTIHGKVPKIMFSHGNWPGNKAWMMANQFSCGVIPALLEIWRARRTAGKDFDFGTATNVIIETLSFFRERYYHYPDGSPHWQGAVYGVHPVGKETVERKGAIHWGEGLGAHTSDHVGEAYHPIEARVQEGSSVQWMMDFYGVLWTNFTNTVRNMIPYEFFRNAASRHLNASGANVWSPYHASAHHLVNRLDIRRGQQVSLVVAPDGEEE